MKKLSFVLALLLFCTFTIPYSHAAEKTQATPASSFVIEGKTLTKFIGAQKKVVIPDGVTEIGEGAFADCSSLKSVVIPEGVTVIGNGAFSECSSLKSVVIPDSVTKIGE